MRALRALAEALVWSAVVSGLCWLVLLVDLTASRTTGVLVVDDDLGLTASLATIAVLTTAVPTVVAWHLRLASTRLGAAVTAVALGITGVLWRGVEGATLPAYVALVAAVGLLAVCLVPGAWAPVPAVVDDLRARVALAVLAVVLLAWPGLVTVVSAARVGVAAPEGGEPAWTALVLGLGWCAACVAALLHLLRRPAGTAPPAGASRRAPRILVVEHEAACPPGHVGRWLADAGADVEVRRPWQDEDVPSLGEGRGYDGLVVLGGSMGANDDATVPWLPVVKERIREADRAGLPVLGICLGHQLAAVALGGTVEVNRLGQSVGVLPVGWRPGADEDPLMGTVRAARRGIHWNSDVVTALPAGAELLATTPEGDPQVVRFAPTVWGVQLHPEADRAIVESWAAGDRDDHLERGVDTDGALDEIEAAADELARAWRPLADRFAALAVDRPVRTGGPGTRP